jgi:hypothetical protein
MRGRSSLAVLTLSFGTSLFVQAQTPPIPVYLSDEFVANTVTTGNQRRPAVAGNADGNVLIVWHSDAAQAGFFDIKGQLFDREGDPIGGEFQVDQAGTNRIQYTPQAAAGGNGNYVVVWADFNQTVTDSEVWMRRFDSAGNPLAAAEQVNTHTTGQQRLPRVAANDAGEFVVVWESAGQDGSGYGIFARLYAANGTPQTNELPVNTVTTGHQTRAAVDIDDFGFTVVFNDANTGVEARDIGLAALSGPQGIPQYNVFDTSHRNPDIAYLASASTAGFSEGMKWSDFRVVAENFTNGLVSARDSLIWSLQNPFPAGYGFNASLAVTQINGFNVGYILTDRPNMSATYDLGVSKFGDRPNGSSFFEIFTIPKGNTVPSVPDADIADAQGWVAGGDEAGVNVWGQRGGFPGGLGANLLGTPAVFKADVARSFSFGFGNYSSDPFEALAEILYEPLASASSGNGLTINDGTADYGAIPAGSIGDCQGTGDCYNVTPNGPRPGPHWDEAVTETLSSGVSKTWLLHIGDSFADVPDTNPFYAFIENLLHNGVTGGGACGGYCPADGVKRQQMAVFLLKSRFGASFVPPPATGTVFTDVPITNPFAPWIEALFLLGITGGCSGGPPPAPIQFCPDAIVNRQQMATFLLKTVEGSTYLPPDPAGIFTDVPTGNPFARWIEELYNRQVTGGCVQSPLQYCPTNPTNRQQMAAFLVKTFGLLLYGP